MTYAEFINGIKGILYPDREAANLATNHSRYVLDGWIWLQKRVPQLQDHHYQIVDFDDTLFDCCTTVITKPDGVIRRVYTYTLDNQCDAIFYQPVTYEAFLSNVRTYIACGSCSVPQEEDEAMSKGAWTPGGQVATPEGDKGYRAANGIWTIRGKELLLFPNIESFEHVGIHWRGVKLQYAPTDPVDIPLDAQSVIELYVQSQTTLREDCDTNEFVKFKQAADLAAGDLIWWYRNKDEPPEMDWRGTGCELCKIATGFVDGGGGGGPCPPCPECPEPPPTKVYTIYLGNGGPDEKSSYTEAEIKALPNSPFGNTTDRTVLPGFYQIAAPASGGNEYRVIAFPLEMHSGPVGFTSAGFGLPMVDLGQTSVDGIAHRVFRTGTRSAGDFTNAGLTSIVITPFPS